MDHYEPRYLRKKECYPCSHPSEESCERSFSDIAWPSHVRKLLNTSYSQNEGPGMKNLCPNKSSLDFSTNPEPASVASSNSFMGKFIKFQVPRLRIRIPSCVWESNESLQCQTAKKWFLEWGGHDIRLGHVNASKSKVRGGILLDDVFNL